MNIHSTAVIHPTAFIGKGVGIGPYSVVGEGVRIGDGCVLQSHVVIERDTVLGNGNLVGHGAVIGAAPQDFAHHDGIRSSVVIGDGNRIREHVTIHRGTGEGTVTRVGDRCFLMVGCHVGHNATVGNDVVLVNDVLLAGHVEVGDGAVLGGAAVFHQFVRIGKRVMVAGNSHFNKDIPPFTLAKFYNLLGGLNVIGLRRAGIDARTRAEIKRAFGMIFLGGRGVRQAATEAAGLEWGAEARELIDFVLSSKRGCSTPNKRAQLGDSVRGEDPSEAA